MTKHTRNQAAATSPAVTTIGVATVGDDDDLSVVRVSISKLNRAQAMFRFQMLEHISVTDALPAGRHSYPNEYFLRRLADERQRFGYLYVIGVTRHKLDEMRFNFHDIGSGSGMITLDNFRHYCPPEVRESQYVGFLLLCECVCLVYRHKEHAERFFCLFDLCDDKDDLKACLRRAQICKPCRAQLVALRVPVSAVSAADSVLAWVRKKDYFRAVARISNRFIPGMLVGLILHMLGAKLVELPGRSGTDVILSLVLVYLWYVLVVLHHSGDEGGE